MRMGFEVRAKLGYVMLALLLAGGMAVSIHRLESLAQVQVAQIRAQEMEITLVERLRWNTELMVSSGRAYLLSGEPSHLAQTHAYALAFNENLHLLKTGTLGSRSPELVTAVEQAATNFRHAQDEVLSARHISQDTTALRLRFETDLVPLRGTLSKALDRLVAYKESSLKEAYAGAAAKRSQIEYEMYALLGLLALAGLGIGWYFSSQLTRSYRKEEVAHHVAQTALTARDELMGIVAHDLRNPLGAIAMKAALLRKETDSKTAQGDAASIENISIRMEYLIKSMLDVTTMEAGRFSVTPAPCGVSDVVHEAMEMFDALAASKHVRLEQEVRQPGLVMYADHERVIQVLSNVLGNALKFTPQGGHVTLSVDQRGRMAHFAVLDSGPGIPDDHLSRVFERYWKVESARSRGRLRGCGL